jgi:4-amino-4-deoxy-L-arabinose transferase-like glycosyltransferase
VYGYFAERLPKYIYAGFVALAILIATKETFIVTLFCVAVSTLMLGKWKSLYLDLRRHQLHLFYGALLAIVLIALCFTGGFQWPGGLREMLLAVPQWISRNQSDIGHFKPFNQYIKYFFACEPLVLVGVLIGGVSVLARFVLAPEEWPESGFVSFCGAWSVSALLVYSFIKYKTPWLMINITLPSLLVVSWWINRAFNRSSFLGMGGVALVLAASIGYTYTYNFKIPYDSRRNLFAYVQTGYGMTNCVADIENYWKTHPDARVLIGVGGYWPLPYYFRNYANRLEYQVPKEPDKEIEAMHEKYGVMILDNKTNWKKDGWTWKYYRLSDVQEAHVYYKRK